MEDHNRGISTSTSSSERPLLPFIHFHSQSHTHTHAHYQSSSSQLLPPTTVPFPLLPHPLSSSHMLTLTLAPPFTPPTLTLTRSNIPWGKNVIVALLTPPFRNTSHTLRSTTMLISQLSSITSVVLAWSVKKTSRNPEAPRSIQNSPLWRN